MDKIIALCAIVFISSCQKDRYFGPVNSTDSTDIGTQSRTSLFIGCEGNFQYGNASMSAINLKDDKIENDVFLRANGYQIGDVLQSMTHHGDSLFLVVNNSGLIRIVNDSTFEEISTIEGLNSPRYMTMLDEDRAVVSDFGGGKLTVIDLSTSEVYLEVPSAKWTERMLISDGLLYVANMTDSSLLIYNPSNMEQITEVSLHIEPSYLFVAEGRILVSGNGRNGSQLLSLDQMHQVQVLQNFNVRLSGASLHETTVYILTNNTVNRVDLSNNSSASFEHSAQTPYSIFVDENGIFISDVVDYLSRGKVLKLTHDFHLQKTFETGLIPQSFSR